ncbi:putative endonuclease/reverse transcriptase [Danaus plexippus plexippus]|uniref:Endonuclease/reverse transcriptase n=1 Tax=Danaus plexippus plexippus TaxID=278856 RepID=A0A212EIU2_DANPL|nr:putative endonuclease/reverse transcriptase [Danaus plexippus plexippus]
MQDVRSQVLNNNFDLVLLTEPWLNGSVLDSEVFDGRYTIYRRDRETSIRSSHKKSGGGVLIAVSNKYFSSRSIDLESDCQDLWVSIQMGVGKYRQNLHCVSAASRKHSTPRGICWQSEQNDSDIKVEECFSPIRKVESLHPALNIDEDIGKKLKGLDTSKGSGTE